MEDIHACWKPPSSARSRKKNVIMVLTESIAKTSQRDSLSRWELTTRHGSRRLQTITAGTPQRERQVRRLRQRGNIAAKERCRRQKEQAASQPSSSEAFTWQKWSMISASRTGLYSHQQVCKSQRLWRNTLITTYFSSNLQPDCKGKKKKKSNLGCFILCVHWEWSLWTVFLHFVITLIIIKYHFLWPPKRQVQYHYHRQ